MMNFSTYTLCVGNSRDFSEFLTHGDYVTLTADSENVRWHITDSEIIEFKSISGSSAEVRALCTGTAVVEAIREDSTKELCYISVIDNFTRHTVQRIEFNTYKLNLKP